LVKKFNISKRQPFEIPGLVSASVPSWTEWYSYDGNSAWDEDDEENSENIRLHHLWGDVYMEKSSFQNTHICPAPIAIKGRNKKTKQIVSESLFEEFNPWQVSCAPPSDVNGDNCNITDFEFQYLCDRSTIQFVIKGKSWKYSVKFDFFDLKSKT